MSGYERVITKTGDEGFTDDYGGNRLPKDSFLFDVVGDLDELNSFLGLCHAAALRENDTVYNFDLIYRIQHLIIKMSAIYSTPSSSDNFKKLKLISRKDISYVEEQAKRVSEMTSIGNHFVLPGQSGSIVSAHFDCARSICRRCERKAVTLYRRNNLDSDQFELIMIFLNRLSDLLFIIARNFDSNV